MLSKYLIQPDGKIFNLKLNRYQYIGTCKIGYSRCWLTGDDGKRKAYSVHRLVASDYVKGKTKLRTDVNHIDGNKGNNNYKNLNWCTKSENQKHAYATGLQKRRNNHK